MQVLGVTTTSKTIRYAVLEFDGNGATLLNKDEENSLKFPANMQAIEQKLHWLQQEFERVLRQYPKIKRIAIKANGFRGETTITRQSTYMDAVILLTATQSKHQIPVCTKQHASIRKVLGGKKGVCAIVS